MIIRLLKSPLFMIGFIVLIVGVGYSFYFSAVLKDTLPPMKSIVDVNEDGFLDRAPFEPSDKFPIGTDENGYPLQYKIIEGAKYTIGFALLITIIRMVLSIFFGLTMRRSLIKAQRVIKGLTNSFHFAPTSLIAYFLLAPMLIVFSWNFSGTTQLVYTVTILTVLAVPTLSLLISSETNQIMNQEFIQNTKVLGGGYFHILKTHVRPYLAPRLFIIFNQQMIQVLLVFAHLGVLGLYMGGTQVEGVRIEQNTGNQAAEAESESVKGYAVYSSMSNEWGGLVANARKDVLLSPWELYYPALAFAIVVLAFIFMLEGFKRAIEPQVRHQKESEKEVPIQKPHTLDADFRALGRMSKAE